MVFAKTSYKRVRQTRSIKWYIVTRAGIGVRFDNWIVIKKDRDVGL